MRIDTCLSLFNTRPSLEEFGITDYYESGSGQDISIYITAPPELEGDYESSLSTKFNWTEGFKRELEFKRRYQAQLGVCASRGEGGLAARFFSTAYPNITKEYSLDDVCEGKTPRPVPTTTTTELSIEPDDEKNDSGSSRRRSNIIFEMILSSLILLWLTRVQIYMDC
jgi:hypothetical protein